MSTRAAVVEQRSPSPTLLVISLKLYLDVASTVAWARNVARIARESPAVRDGRVKLVALPSLPALSDVFRELEGSGVEVGAQDLHWADRGAFTGAVSGSDLRAVGCRYVEVGHAERRRIFGEGDEVVRAKLRAAWRNGLIPVLCVGEREQSDIEQAVAACRLQVETALGAHGDGEVVVAYEPEWAIGAEQPASREHVGGVMTALREQLSGYRGIASFSVIYGGSAQRGTLSGLDGSVDGLFLGRFAHDAGALARIVEEAATLA